MNDDERHKHVINDEGLNNMYKRWKRCNTGGMRGFIKANREFLDNSIAAVRTGAKQPHYLKYG